MLLFACVNFFIAFCIYNVNSFTINNNRHIHSYNLYGVPRLYGWIIDTLPIATKTLASSKNARNVDCLYLDLNGIYHPASHGNTHLSLDLGQKQRIKRIFASISNIYSLIKPKKLLFLASDGVCPVAKINQQRSRRNRSFLFNAPQKYNPEILNKVCKQLQEVLGACGDLNPSTHQFTPNMISPGTEFIALMENELRKWLYFKVSEGFFGECEVVFSGSDVPGEGEHKIFQNIKGSRRLSSIVYGLDADLMLLSSLTYRNKCLILREKSRYTPNVTAKKTPDPYYDDNTGLVYFHKNDFLTFQKRHFEVVNFKMIPTHLYNKTVAQKKGKFIFKQNDEYFINCLTRDFVFLTFLAGNDFLPRVPAVDLSDDSYTSFILSYFNNFDKIGGFITNNSGYSITRFKRFLKFPSALEKNWFMLRGFKLGIPEFSTNDYAKHYYKIKFGVDFADQPKFIEGLVADYFTGLRWNQEYYTRSKSCWNWSYKHHYAPLLTDLCKYKYKGHIFTRGKPASQMVHLLSVCPPEDNYILPEQLRGIEEMNKYFPKNVQVDRDGYSNEWEFVVKMPFIDVQEVKRIVDEKLQDIPLKNTMEIRNRCGVPIHLKFDNHKNDQFLE